MGAHGSSDSAIATSEPNAKTEQDWIQAAFETYNQSTLIYDGDLAERNLYHVTRFVASSPNCLSAHVRRIFLAMRCHNVPAIQGALVDLFLVLKGRGKILFGRLLKLAVLPFSQEIRGSIQQAFASGDVKQVMKLPCGQSVLANGRSGTVFRL